MSNITGKQLLDEVEYYIKNNDEFIKNGDLESDRDLDNDFWISFAKNLKEYIEN